MITSKKYFFFAVFFIFIFALPSLSHSEDAGEAVALLQARYESIKALSADFTQEVKSRAMAVPQVSTGKVWFKKPGKMRWQYTAPVKDEIVSDGSTVWVWQPDLNQALERKVEESASKIATDFLSGVGDLKKDFEVKLAEGTDKTVRLSLTPRAPQPNLKKLTIEADRKEMLVTSTVIEDAFGNSTTVSFRDIKVNPTVKDDLFRFIPPKGAGVVRP